MCGIAGVFSSALREPEVHRMTEALAHRGPDDAGLSPLRAGVEGTAGAFGHRRLSILDLSSAGHQPMRTPDGRFTLAYNGEIYNFRELRQALERTGGRFSSQSDTEVLLLGWAAEGLAFLERVRGMFAFSVWDRAAGAGWLVRDPFGIKPLYVAEVGGEVIFASEVRAILASGRIGRRLCTDAVADYLSTGSVADPLTLIEGVRAVGAGTALPVSMVDGAFRTGTPVRFGAPPHFGEGALDGDAASAARLVRDALGQSVSEHLVSDVPLAFFLSGGIDSSVVVALAAEATATTLETFTVTFAEAGFNEAAPAAALARRFGTRHHEVPLSGSDLLSALPDAFAAMDQPSMDGLNTFVVSRAVRARGIKVVLSGLGGDEFFAGYPSFQRAAAVAPLWGLPAPVRGLVSRAAGAWPGVRGAKAALLFGEETPARGAYRASRTLFADAQVRAMIGTNPVDSLPGPPAGLSLLQQVTWYEASGYMRNTLLRDSDVFSMAHGLELRVPLVSTQVAAAAARVDDALKLTRGRSKPLLLSAVHDLLPRATWDRPKQGFTLPFAVFMREALRPLVQAGLSDRHLGRVGIDAPEARRVWADFQGGRVGWSRPWALYTLLRWAEEHELSIDAAFPGRSAEAVPAAR